MNKYDLLKIMNEKKFNQRKLAKTIGISENSMSSKINGKKPFNTVEIDSICDALEIEDTFTKAHIFLDESSQKRDKSAKIYPA